MSALLFNLENVNVVYKDLIVLRQVNLKIRAGEKIAIVGPCGAGKTVLLEKLYQIRPQECGFIHQHFPLIPQLSVIDNIHLKRLNHLPIILKFLKYVKLQKKKNKKILSILQTLEIEDKIFTQVRQLSDDQKQRAAIGRAIYRNNPILLADEPVASMNLSQADAVLNVLIDTKNTVIMVLHSVELTLKYAQRIVGLCDGRIRFDLPVDHVTTDHITDLYLSY